MLDQFLRQWCLFIGCLGCLEGVLWCSLSTIYILLITDLIEIQNDELEVVLGSNHNSDNEIYTSPLFICSVINTSLSVLWIITSLILLIFAYHHKNNALPKCTIAWTVFATFATASVITLAAIQTVDIELKAVFESTPLIILVIISVLLWIISTGIVIFNGFMLMVVKYQKKPNNLYFTQQQMPQQVYSSKLSFSTVKSEQQHFGDNNNYIPEPTFLTPAINRDVIMNDTHSMTTFNDFENVFQPAINEEEKFATIGRRKGNGNGTLRHIPPPMVMPNIPVPDYTPPGSPKPVLKLTSSYF